MSTPKTRRSTTTQAPQSFPKDITVRDVDLDTEEVVVGGKRLTEARAQGSPTVPSRAPDAGPPIGLRRFPAPPLGIRACSRGEHGQA